MKTGFKLCSACTAQFQALRFDPNASCHSVLLPFGSIVWGDELPARDDLHFLHHRECNFSMIHLFALRKEIWQSGNHGEPNQEVWLEARAVIPDWPGFQRLSLNQDQKDALKFCEQETEELMDDFRKTSSVFSLTAFFCVQRGLARSLRFGMNPTMVRSNRPVTAAG